MRILPTPLKYASLLAIRRKSPLLSFPFSLLSTEKAALANKDSGVEIMRMYLREKVETSSLFILLKYTSQQDNAWDIDKWSSSGFEIVESKVKNLKSPMRYEHLSVAQAISPFTTGEIWLGDMVQDQAFPFIAETAASIEDILSGFYFKRRRSITAGHIEIPRLYLGKYTHTNDPKWSIDTWHKHGWQLTSIEESEIGR